MRLKQDCHKMFNVPPPHSQPECLGSAWEKTIQELKEMITTTRDYFICIINVPRLSHSQQRWEKHRTQCGRYLRGGWKIMWTIATMGGRFSLVFYFIFCFLRDEHRISANRKHLLSLLRPVSRPLSFISCKNFRLLRSTNCSISMHDILPDRINLQTLNSAMKIWYDEYNNCLVEKCMTALVENYCFLCDFINCQTCGCSISGLSVGVRSWLSSLANRMNFHPHFPLHCEQTKMVLSTAIRLAAWKIHWKSYVLDGVGGTLEAKTSFHVYQNVIFKLISSIDFLSAASSTRTNRKIRLSKASKKTFFYSFSLTLVTWKIYLNRLWI